MGVRPHTLPLLGLLAAAACDRPPSSQGLPEWTPADHDRAEEKTRLRTGAQVSATPGQKDDGATLVELAWAQRCAACHGPYGRGDGPEGASVKAPDLTREEWQARVTDADVAASIRAGKGAMPRFDLPPAVVLGLVGRIRAYRGAKETAP